MLQLKVRMGAVVRVEVTVKVQVRVMSKRRGKYRLKAKMLKVRHPANMLKVRFQQE